MAIIFICGDPHGDFSHIIRAALVERPLAVILLGDMDLTSNLDEVLKPLLGVTEILWIHGNHDTDTESTYDNLFQSDRCRNLHGKILTVHGRRIAGLGGVFRSKVWDGQQQAWFRSPADYLAVCGKGNRWRDGLPLKHRSTLFPSDFDAFLGERADVLVTHEAPVEHPHGFSVISELAQRLNVEVAFHGHHHETIAYPESVWRGVGLREILRYSW